MVQPYGAVQSPMDSASSDNENEDYFDSGAEASALLGSDRDTPVILAGPDGHATIVSCVSNLCNTIIGSGMSSCVCIHLPFNSIVKEC